MYLALATFALIWSRWEDTWVRRGLLAPLKISAPTPSPSTRRIISRGMRSTPSPTCRTSTLQGITSPLSSRGLPHGPFMTSQDTLEIPSAFTQNLLPSTNHTLSRMSAKCKSHTEPSDPFDVVAWGKFKAARTMWLTSLDLEVKYYSVINFEV